MGIGDLISSSLTGAGMPELLVYLFFLGVGLVMIIKGGDWFVDAASWFAEISGIPKLIVGATVVSLATTLPELLVSLFAAADGHRMLLSGASAAEASSMVDMAIGNAVGSVTANLGLILGISMVCMPAIIKRKDYAVKMALMSGAAVVIVVFGLLSYNGVIGFGILPSILLLILFALAVFENVRSARAEMQNGNETGAIRPKPGKKEIGTNIVKFLLGTVGIVFGADLLVDNASLLAGFMGVSDRVISVTIVAIGTSLPEFVTAITAIIKKQGSLSAGNIIGANIIDLTLILPLCALVYGGNLPVTETVARVDLPASLILCAAAVAPSLITKKFSRWQGVFMLCLYAGYLVLTTVIVA